jgi:pyruvate/2-oxoglutarate dehydrogenase complex dihydrolipoamide dehydrogenase (E3) component
MQTFDAIVIGSGQGGTPLAKKLAKAGLKTIIVEKRLVGGTCINDGCTPTKSMIASAKMADNIRRSKDLGINTGDFTVDLEKIIARKNKIVASFHDSAEKGLIATDNLTLIMGEAFFAGHKIISVNMQDGNSETYTADKIFINTGTTTKIPSIEGINDVPYYTSTSLLDVEKLPRHLIIVGGGYIALEYAQMFKRFGSKVSMIIRDKEFLSKEDDDISDCIAGIFKEEGIKISLESKVEKIACKTTGELTLFVSVKGRKQEITGSHILLATGRIPQTKPLQLEKTGVIVNEKGYINVDEYLQTSEPGIYALGDVKGGPAFTHIAYNDHLVILKNILKNSKESIKGRPVPYTIFTDPQLGRIGITEKEALEQGLNIDIATLSMDKVARGIETGQTKGLMKAVVDKDTKQILGASILCAEGGEVMSVLQMAMQGKVTHQQIRENIFAHPLYSESLNNLFMKLDK